ncbi:MAG TPA: zf-HC2 domain-containing protein [Terriglobales bacterium]|nr:zf-HC2 domain-containing protein [Terriglobales bacterium]
MICEWRTQLDAYADGELQPPELSKLETHLRSCPSCAAEALGRIQMKRSISAAATKAFNPSPEFRARIERSILRRTRRSSQWLPKLVFSTAMSVALLLAVLLLVRNRNHPEVATEAIDLHVSTLASANPVDVVSTDRHTVKPWFQGKLPFTFDLPELAKSEFRLIGGRMAYIEQSPAAHLLFGIRKHEISLFIVQDSEALERDFPSGTSHRLDFNVDTWSESGLRYIAVSDVNSADLEALRSLLNPKQ